MEARDRDLRFFNTAGDCQKFRVQGAPGLESRRRTEHGETGLAKVRHSRESGNPFQSKVPGFPLSREWRIEKYHPSELRA